MCSRGRCVNTEGSYRCNCFHGYKLSSDNVCQGNCLSEGQSHIINAADQSCGNSSLQRYCRSFEVSLKACRKKKATKHLWLSLISESFLFSPFPCIVSPDVDECLLPGVCFHGLCVNLDGTHKCICNHGYQVTSDSKSCEGLQRIIQSCYWT